MKDRSEHKKVYASHSIIVSRGPADTGLGEEASVRLEIRYISLYRLKRRKDQRMQFPVSQLEDILSLLNKIKHETGS